jgi:hypothetical protein
VSREQQREARRARRKARFAARTPGSVAHLKALTRHRTLGTAARRALRTDDRSEGLEREVELAAAREARRLLDHAERLNIGATRIEKLVAATQREA